MRVVGIGQCSWDYLAVVDPYPAVDTKAEILDWREQGGGPVATALSTLARLGIPSDFYGVVGDDPEGERIRESLISEGISVAGLVTRESSASQVAFIAIENRSARRTIFWRRPSGKAILPEEIPDNFTDSCSFLLLDGLFSDASLFAARRARERGVPVMLDAGRNRPGMLETARTCDYVVASEQFALDLGWDGSREDFGRLADCTGPGVFTLTIGERGSITRCDGDTIIVPAFPVAAVDTTGAGDVFHGGYIYGLLRGLGLAEAIRFATAAAALKCRQVGGRAGIPHEAEVLGFLAGKGITLSY